MFELGYVYGHLLFAAIALTIAFALAVSALRIPGLRSDWWFAVLYATATAGAVTGTWISSSGTLAAARAFFAIDGLLFMLATAGGHAQYAGLVLSPPARRRHRLQVAGYVAIGALVVAGILTGAFDRGHTITNRLWGAHATVIALPWWEGLLLVLFCLGNIPINGPLLWAPGPRAFERRVVSGAMLSAPAVVLWELSIAVGINHLLPVSGYFAGLLGLHGAFVLIERFRNFSQSGGVLGEYVIERRIGSGGMAEVFLGYRELTGPLHGVVRRAAVKRLRAEFAEDPKFVRMFLAEARIASRLRHPNIVELYDAGAHKGQLYLAMELVDGASLAQMFHALTGAGRRLSLEAVIEIATQLSAALDYVHSLCDDDGRPLQMIHRDVSPQNVLVDGSGLVKLADFGIARSIDHSRHTETGALKGKLSYMAQEQIRGESYDHRVDLYAAGVILYELATGHRLHEGVSEPALMFRVLKGEAPSLDRLADVPAPLADVIRRALSPVALERPARAGAIREALDAVRAEQRARSELAEVVTLAREWQKKRELADAIETQAAVVSGRSSGA